MSETEALTQAEPEAPETDLPVANMTLIAQSPDQLQREQKRLIAWCTAKMSEVESAIADLEASIAHHRKLKWGYAPLRNALTRENERFMFYVKVRDALEAGFYIVPNFPCDVFAIRTEHEPSGTASATHRGTALQSLPNAPADVLPSGEGEYENPRVEGMIVNQYQRSKSYPPKTTDTETVYVADARPRSPRHWWRRRP